MESKYENKRSVNGMMVPGDGALSAIVTDEAGNNYFGRLVGAPADTLHYLREGVPPAGRHTPDDRTLLATIDRLGAGTRHTGRLSWVGVSALTAEDLEEPHHKARFRPSFREYR